MNKQKYCLNCCQMLDYSIVLILRKLIRFSNGISKIVFEKSSQKRATV